MRYEFIKIRNTLAEITGASVAMIWMWYKLTEASIMTIESISKVLAQGIGISIIIIIALTIVINIFSSIKSLETTRKILKTKGINFMNSMPYNLVARYIWHLYCNNSCLIRLV